MVAKCRPHRSIRPAGPGLIYIFRASKCAFWDGSSQQDLENDLHHCHAYKCYKWTSYRDQIRDMKKQRQKVAKRAPPPALSMAEVEARRKMEELEKQRREAVGGWDDSPTRTNWGSPER